MNLCQLPQLYFKISQTGKTVIHGQHLDSILLSGINAAASAEEGDWKVHFSPKLCRGWLQWCNRSIVSICVRIWPPLHHITLLYLITSTDNKTECDWLLDTCITIISIRNHFSNHQVETPSYCSLLQHHKQTWSLLQYTHVFAAFNQMSVGSCLFSISTHYVLSHN